MNKDIEKLYKKIYAWLMTPSSCVPDVEIDYVWRWIDGKIQTKGANKPCKEVVEELLLLRAAVHNLHSGCPDVSMGYIVDWMRGRIAEHHNITDLLDKETITPLFFRDMTKKELVSWVLWCSYEKLYEEYSDNDIDAYIDLLVEAGKINGGDGVLSFRK